MRSYFQLSLLLIGTISVPATVYAQTAPQDLELQRAREREAAIRAQQPKSPDVRSIDGQSLPDAARPIRQLPFAESPAFPITKIYLIGDEAWRFQSSMRKALVQTGLEQRRVGRDVLLFQRGQNQPGVPLGAEGINELMRAMQNDVISRGFTTTRIVASPQDLNVGTLILTVIPGRIRNIVVDTDDIAQTHAYRANTVNALPIRSGDILNLRDIEQGLENLKRVPTVEADIQIRPGTNPNESDLVIRWMQRKNPLRLHLSLDDAGGKSTGEIQVGATLSWDHPLRLNDLFYVSVGSAVAGFDDVSTLDGLGSVIGEEHGSSRNWSAHYSVPMGYSLLSLNASGYRYRQAIAGTSQTYHYTGNSRTQDMKLSRILHRTSRGKTSTSLKGWYRDSNNFIDDVEITVQRRRTAGWELGLAHRQFIGASTLDLSAAYRRGTGARNALRAPEEGFGEGTSRMGLYTADIALNTPLGGTQSPWNYSGTLHSQWNSTPLTQQDKLAIGGRYTVRGFDGEMMLAAERGHILRNEWSLAYRKSHQTYLALDAGHVSGRSTEYLLGQSLIGSAIGLRGAFKLGGTLSYDVFAGTPVKKPAGFPASDVVTGFNLNYSF